MLLLFETPAGFALFKVLDEGKLSKVEVTYFKLFTSIFDCLISEIGDIGENLAYNSGIDMWWNRVTLTFLFYKNGKSVRSGDETVGI